MSKRKDSLLRKREEAQKLLDELEVRAAKFTNSEIDSTLVVDIKNKKEEIFMIDNELFIINEEMHKITAIDNNIIPFINRERELENILVSAEAGNISAKYFIVDAPSGYGKSVFLEELNRRFTSKKDNPDKIFWDHALVKISPTSDPYQMYEELVSNLGLEINNSSDASLGYKLSSGWIQKHNINKYGGVVLLIDFDSTPNKDALELLIKELIPQFQKNLYANLLQYQKGNLAFRVIIAGRNLTKSNVFRETSLPFTEIYLSAFNHDNVDKTIYTFMPYLPENTRSELAAHILFFTGGHPGAMGEILIRFRSDTIPNDEIGKEFQQKYWGGIIRKYADEIAATYSQDDILMPLIENIQFFRYLNDKLLREFIGDHNKEKEIENAIDPILVGDFIKGTHLYRRDDSNFLVDAIARRLMIIWLRHNRKQNEFTQYSRKAQITCGRLIKEDRRHAGKWFLEYIFQEIQGANFEDSKEKRKELFNRIFSETIPYVTQIFLSRSISSDDKKDECSDLLAEIYTSKHWEFRFLFNYQLRNEYYSNDPINKLVENLQEIFNQ